MSNLFQRAARFNDEGIIALTKGDKTTALAAMVQAMEVLKAGLSQLTDHDPHCHLNQAFGVSVTNHTIQFPSTIKIPNLEALDSIAFDQAIRIPADLMEPSKDDFTLYLGVVIYNMALVHHLNAAASEDISERSKMMVKAEKLYGMVSRIFLKDTAFLGAYPALVLKLACVGNLTRIYYTRGDYTDASKDRRQVLSWFLRQSSSSQLMIGEPKIQSLLMLILLTRPPVVAAAA